MKKFNSLLVLAMSVIFILSSCSVDDDGTPIDEEQPILYNPPTAEEFKTMQDDVFNSLVQTAQFDAENGIYFTSDRGAILQISPNCLSLNGDLVTGAVDLEFVEIYERGDMLTADKTTTGKKPDNSLEQLISGGQFHIKAYQNGEELTADCGMLLSVPVDITGGEQEDMSGFVGEINEDDDLIWLPQVGEFWIGQNQGGANSYNAFIEDFGFFNCDYFANFPEPKTEIQIALPVGFNHANSEVYVSISEQPNSLALLYGAFPIGFDLHVIFVSAEGNDFRYAVKSITVEDNHQLIYTIEETTVASYEDLVDAINALP